MITNETLSLVSIGVNVEADPPLFAIVTVFCRLTVYVLIPARRDVTTLILP